MKCQSHFSGENKKRIINVYSAEIAHREVMVKDLLVVIDTGYSILTETTDRKIKKV